MGCDIHLYKEKHVDGRWVAADEWSDDEYEPGRKEVPWKTRFTERNYQLFGLLSAGVRSDHPFALAGRGMPLSPSPEVAEENERWGVDAHSHSYLYLHELKELALFLEAATIKVSGMKDADELAALRDSIASGAPNWDLLFPYCAGTTDTRAVEFEIDVPASYYMGSALQRIIAGFDGIDAANHRIVFWFDN